MLSLEAGWRRMRLLRGYLLLGGGRMLNAACAAIE
jgi:hypothetical protein